MAEDLDVEAMLEAPYKKNDEHSSSKHRSDKHSDRHKHSERSKEASKRSGGIMSHQLVGRRPIKLTTIVNTEGEEVEVERREDPEEKAIADKIVNLFIQAGYFQINHEISLFHKITSGMIWCLQSANYGFDTDSFTGFDEQTNIRNKIFLSEKIIRVLLSKSVKCPHVIQPHQILGLNVEHLFPLIKWLVNHCVQVQKHHKDDFLRIASQYLDTKQFASSLLDVSEIRYSSLLKIIDFYAPYRKYIWNFPKKLKENTKYCKSEFSNVVYKNNDDTNKLPPDLLIKVSKSAPLKRTELYSDSNRNAHYDRLNDELFGDDLPCIKVITPSKKKNIFSHVIHLNKPSVVEENSTEPAIKDLPESNLACAKIDSMINEVIKLEEDRERLKQRSLRQNESPKRVQTETKSKLSLNELQDIECQIDEEMGKLNEDLTIHIREEWSKGLEKQIYQERLNELQSQIIMTTVQTKQHYAHYNTLIDIQAYKNKEINLLNSVIENYERAKTSKNYQDQYLKQLENVTDWIKQTKDKLLNKHGEARNKRNETHKQWANLMQMERDYAKVTRDIKMAVSQSNVLRSV